MNGVYKVSFSFMSIVDTNDDNFVYVFVNDQQVPESIHSTYNANSERVTSTGGRVILLSLMQGYTVHLATSAVQGYLYEIMTCVEYVSHV